MISREQLLEFAKHYQESLDRYQDLNDQLLMPCSREVWLKVLENRSAIVRDAFARNETWFSMIYGEMEHMTMEQADIFYDAITTEFFATYSSIDYPLVIDMAESILPLYETARDYDRVMQLYILLSYMNLEYYDRLSEKDNVGESLKYAEKLLANKEHYTDIKRAHTRIAFFQTTYSILLSQIADMYEIPFETVSEWYDDLASFWQSDTVQALDGKDANFIGGVEYAKNCFYSHCYNCIVNTVKHTDGNTFSLHYVENMLSAMPKDVIDTYDTLRKCRRILDVVRKKQDAHALVCQLMEDLENLPEPDFGSSMSVTENTAALQRLNAIVETVDMFFDMLDMADFTKEERPRHVKRVIRLFLQKMKKVPSCHRDNGAVSDMYTALFYKMLPYLDSFSEKEAMLEKLIISHQPLTFVHSCMVEKLAVILAEAIITRQPEIFRGIPGYETAAALSNQKEAFLAYIGKCGSLHDIGKCEIAGVINMQTHKVTDREFGCIKRHPRCGVNELENDPDFETFIPIILGHHRTFDGKGGYPADFDILSSPYKPVIDLISICDSLDAATDQFGRNYHKTKKFDTVLEELKHGAATRYNPDIVKLIDEDTSLQEKLRYMVTDGRAEAYYEAYQKCQGLAEVTL